MPDGFICSPGSCRVTSGAPVASTNSTDLGVRFNAAPGVATVKTNKHAAMLQPADCVTLVVRATVPRGDIPIQCYQSDRVFLVTDPQQREGDHMKWSDLLTELVTRQLVMVGSIISLSQCVVWSNFFYISGNVSPFCNWILSGFFQIST